MTEGWSVDIDTFLSEITDSPPAGYDLRYREQDETYDQIKNARRTAEPSVAVSATIPGATETDWDTVRIICEFTLRTRSKDLQIAAWLLEAWLHLYRLPGVVNGLALILRLSETFWDDIYPLRDDAGDGLRLSPFRWINEKLSLSLKQLPSTQPETDSSQRYTWVDYENTLRQRVGAAAGEVTPKLYHESEMLTPTTFYAQMASELRQALRSTQALETFLENKYGPKSPSLAQFKAELQTMRDKITAILIERNESEESGDLSAPRSDASMTPSRAIHNREEAYQRLSAIADYLMLVEPHSPTSYLIRRAVSWGSMSLTDLLVELVQGQGDRQAIFGLLGIKDTETG